MKALSLDPLRKAVPFFHREYAVAIGVILVVLLLAMTGALNNLEYKAYDSLMHLKRPTPERNDIVMVCIDDPSIAELGSFPWPRDILADAIIRMRELGARTVVFDIDYLSPSALGANPQAQGTIPANFGDTYGVVSEFIETMAVAVENDYFTADEVREMIGEYITPEFDGLLNTVMDKMFRDNDQYFGKALHFFGNSWLTVNAANLEIPLDPDDFEYLKERIFLSGVEADNELVHEECEKFYHDQGTARGITPTIRVLLDKTAGAGYTNVLLDGDGARRRIKPLFDVEDTESQYLAQLVIAPILGGLKPERIVRNKRSLQFVNARHPDYEEPVTITIPLDDDGNMLINWVPSEFADSFSYESVYFLHQLDTLEQNMVDVLSEFLQYRMYNSSGHLLTYYQAAEYLLREYQDCVSLKESLLDDLSTDILTSPRYASYVAQHAAFMEDSLLFINPDVEAEVFDELPRFCETESDLAAFNAYFARLFDEFRSSLTLYNSVFESLKPHYENAFCIVGHTATASTDLGTTPFTSGYPNVGTHANVYNTIMTQNFIKPLPWYTGIIIASIMLLVLAVVFQSFPLYAQNISNIAGILVFVALSLVLFRAGQVYMELVAGTLIMVVGAIGMMILRFIKAEKEKGFIRQAFSTYLSDTVVDQIIKDPSKLSLGGEEKYLTAMFTDIRSFSTLSEKVTPTQLVSFLNKYLTLLSDIILENNGTIDKYEGDAIIAFFGAPISFEDHAWRACISAVRMKEAERDFNREMLAAGIIPSEVRTRIGLNTGNIVVGNMGTDAKMNYTMMGNAVNLAARLEGVNKVYHSWILVSEETWNGANSGEHEGVLLGRRFDRVRVVGINTPVQLVNILGVRSELPPELIESVNLFHKGLDLYLAKDFGRAKEVFDKATEAYPEDEAASVFAERCTVNLENGVPDDWDGVVNMTSK